MNLDMTLPELKEWLKGRQPVHYGRDFYDSCGNRDYSMVYKDGDKFYQVDFMNEHPCEKFGPNGYIRGTYELKEVLKRVDLVEEVWFISLDELKENEERRKNEDDFDWPLSYDI